MASGCGQYVGPVVVVTGSSECDQWVWSVGVVSGWCIYCLSHNEISILLLCLCFLAYKCQI